MSMQRSELQNEPVPNKGKQFGTPLFTRCITFAKTYRKQTEREMVALARARTHTSICTGGTDTLTNHFQQHASPLLRASNRTQNYCVHFSPPPLLLLLLFHPHLRCGSLVGTRSLHSTIIELVPLALASTSAVLLLLLPVRIVVVLAGNIALRGSLLGALGFRNFLVYGTVVCVRKKEDTGRWVNEEWRVRRVTSTLYI